MEILGSEHKTHLVKHEKRRHHQRLPHTGTDNKDLMVRQLCLQCSLGEAASEQGGEAAGEGGADQGGKSASRGLRGFGQARISEGGAGQGGNRVQGRGVGSREKRGR